LRPEATSRAVGDYNDSEVTSEAISFSFIIVPAFNAESDAALAATGSDCDERSR
jgi:hypothetical protein